MDNFNYTKKDNYSQSELDNLLEHHRNFVYKESKKDYEPKLKEYESKVNEYQDKELFNGLTDKQINLAKSLISNYKDISKTDALNKIKEEYSEIFNNNANISNEVNKVETKKEEVKYFNPSELLKLDNIYNSGVINLDTKAKTKGLTDKQEILDYIKQQFSDIK